MLSSDLDRSAFGQQLASTAVSLADAMATGDVQAVDDGALQMLLAASVRAMAAKHQAGVALQPFGQHAAVDVPTATDVAIVVTAMLESADIEIFELGLWNSWGRAATEKGSNGG